MATKSEKLILQGMSIIIRMSASPSEPAAQARHFTTLQNDITAWCVGSANELAKPASDEVHQH